MCRNNMEYKGEGSCSCSCSCSSPTAPSLPVLIHDHHLQHIQGQHHLHQEQHHQSIDVQVGAAGGANEGGFMFPSQVATINLPWTLPSLHSSTITTTTTTNTNNSSGPIQHDLGRLYSSLLPPPPVLPSPPPHLYGDFYTRRAAATALQLGHDGGLLPQDPLGLAGLYMASGGGGPEAYFHGGGMPSTTSSPFSSLQSEFGKMTAQEIMDAKALAASKSHSEAERRRRERINAHLARLRSLLPSTTKTDKASLLAEVIQHVKELKRQTSQIVEESPVPTESDELTVDATNDEDGNFVVKASMCCDDRSDLLTELIKALKALRLRALKAEITTLGGRVKNVLVITGEDDCDTMQQTHYSVSSIQEALKAVMERSSTASDGHQSSTTQNNIAAGTSSSAGVKRQRTTNLSSMLENRSI